MAPIKIFTHKKIDNLTSHVFIEEDIDILILCGGAMVPNCINVMKNLFMENEISASIKPI